MQRVADTPRAPNLQKQSAKAPQVDLYSDEKLLLFFQKYADEEDGRKTDVMGIEGIQRLFEDAGLSIEGASPFLLAWICQASEFGVFQQGEFLKLRAYQ